MESLDKVSVRYNDTYLGAGYFILLESVGLINKFVKIYMSGNVGFPVFHIRAFERGTKDMWNQEFRNVEIGVSEDDNLELYNVHRKLRYSLLFHDKDRLNTIDPINQGLNHVKVLEDLKKEVLVVSKSIYRGHFVTPNYIDVILGDRFSCESYEAVLSFYRGISGVSEGRLDNDDVKRLILM
jgi:hypothetical protein